MALKDLFITKPEILPATADVAASLAPINTLDSIFNFLGTAGVTATRLEFM